MLPIQSASAADLKVATWNLGWHLSAAEADDWIAKCGAPFEKRADGKRYPAASGTPGWVFRWGRDANIEWDIAARPPCDVYQLPHHSIVPVTAPACAKRDKQIARLIADKVGADVVAFEEASGERAVREVLPSGGTDWNVCSCTMKGACSVTCGTLQVPARTR